MTIQNDPLPSPVSLHHFIYQNPQGGPICITRIRRPSLLHSSLTLLSNIHQMAVERVQAIASLSKSLDTIPLEFIRSEHERPGTTTFHGPAPEIPVVDLADPDRDRVVQAVVKAGQEWGIFQLVNHGIPVEVMNEVQRVGKEFFELPQEEKEAYAMKPESETLEGYGTKLQKDLEGKKGWVDFFFHNIWPPSRVNHSIWPKNPPSYRFEFNSPGYYDELF